MWHRPLNRLGSLFVNLIFVRNTTNTQSAIMVATGDHS